MLGELTRVLIEHTAAVHPERLGATAGHLTYDGLRQVDAPLRLVLAV